MIRRRTASLLHSELYRDGTISTSLLIIADGYLILLILVLLSLLLSWFLVRKVGMLLLNMAFTVVLSLEALEEKWTPWMRAGIKPSRREELRMCVRLVSLEVFSCSEASRVVVAMLNWTIM